MQKLKVELSQRVADFLENGVDAMERLDQHLRVLDDQSARQIELLRQLGEIVAEHQRLFELMAASAHSAGAGGVTKVH